LTEVLVEAFLEVALVGFLVAVFLSEVGWLLGGGPGLLSMSPAMRRRVRRA
jgi:hypothetical protein